jgi:hypothetical protein
MLLSHATRGHQRQGQYLAKSTWINVGGRVLLRQGQGMVTWIQVWSIFMFSCNTGHVC